MTLIELHDNHWVHFVNEHFMAFLKQVFMAVRPIIELQTKEEEREWLAQDPIAHAHCNPKWHLSTKIRDNIWVMSRNIHTTCAQV